MLCGLVLFHPYQTRTPAHHEAAEILVRSIVTTVPPWAREQTRLEYTGDIMVYSRQDREQFRGTAFQLVQVITVQQKLVALSYFILTILYLVGARHLASSLVSTAHSFHTGETVDGPKEQFKYAWRYIRALPRLVWGRHILLWELAWTYTAIIELLFKRLGEAAFVAYAYHSYQRHWGSLKTGGSHMKRQSFLGIAWWRCSITSSLAHVAGNASLPSPALLSKTRLVSTAKAKECPSTCWAS